MKSCFQREEGERKITDSNGSKQIGHRIDSLLYKIYVKTAGKYAVAENNRKPNNLRDLKIC